MSDNNCSCWRTVYEHEADGTPLSGDINDLVDAIKSGGVDVQLGYAFITGDRQGEWRRTCSSVTYFEGDGGPVVSCMITDIPDTQLVPAGRNFPFPLAFEWQAYNTSGARWIVTFHGETRAILGYIYDPVRIAWYVRGVQS